MISIRPATHRRRSLVLLLLVALVASPLLLSARPAQAAFVFTVNDVGDASDLGAAQCDTDPGPAWRCTLRAAIESANAFTDTNTIRFDIPGALTQVHSIQPATELPTITQPVTINGYTQPGSSVNTAAVGTNAQLRIELNGLGTVPIGLLIQAPNVRVKGLVINRFTFYGIEIIGATGVTITGCFLGTDAGGTVAHGNGLGVVVATGSATTTIGGTAPAARNLLSGNTLTGVYVSEAGVNTVIQGNLIGTTRTGTGALGNGREGVNIDETSGATVGGNVAGSPNTIAFNGIGVVVQVVAGPAPVGNRILQNAIFGNGGLGIDLGDDGRTANDTAAPRDADTGPNDLQNYPEFTAATTTVVRGRLLSTPNQAFVLRFFSNPAGEEGKVFLGSRNVVTSPNGIAPFTFTPTTALRAGHLVTATATNEGGSTSEFSVPRVVSAA